jgi:hypothetical protein
VGFEPTIAVLERAKTVRALDRSTTAIGYFLHETLQQQLKFLTTACHIDIFITSSPFVFAK